MSSLIRRTGPFFAALLVAATAGLVTVPPATATTSTLCKGYAACAKAGMGNDGYNAAGSTMYWRMYAGHNCTNYVAYRMVRSGLPNTRPWTGGGNASEWGTAMASITDDKPAVGAVAWWKANVKGAGKSGHVAYVEQVVSADEIIVSQDSWGGDFSWARITRSGTGWPSGFIHVNDVPLTNTAAPKVQGETKVGSVLTASPGGWRPSTVSTQYQWRADGRAISGVTGPTLALTESHLGKRITVRVTASHVGYPTRAVTSAATDEVLRGELTSLAAPVLAGTPVVDKMLTLTPGTWDPAPEAVTRQWFVDDVAVPGATGTALALRPADVGKVLTVRETVSRSGFADASVTTKGVGPVRLGTLAVRTAPKLSAHPRLRVPLTVDVGGTREKASASVQWLRDGVPVAGATGTSFVPMPRDLGTRLSARVTWSRAGFTRVERTTARTVTVKAMPKVRVSTTVKGGGRVTVTVRATAAGSSPVDSVVRFRANGRQKAQKKLVKGAASVTLTGLPRGLRGVVVQLPGNSRALGSSVTTKVRIR